MRFVFLADTHWGANPMEFQQQPGYPERLGELAALLKRWIDGNGLVDFVLHGGDMIDQCRADRIQEAAALFDFGVPCYACLGNHDLTRPDAVALWLQHALGFFRSGSVHFEIIHDDCVVHIVPSHWGEEPYYWKDVQAARLSEDQIARVAGVVERYPDRPHVLCTHSQIVPILPEQTGLAEPIHEPWPLVRESVLRLLAEHPQIRCVLGGHNHTNTLNRLGHSVTATVSAFSSTPFEFMVIDITRDQLSIDIHDLYANVGFDAAYDPDRAYAQGRPCDRTYRSQR